MPSEPAPPRSGNTVYFRPEPGDLVPGFRLTDQDGQRLSIFDQFIAGDPVILLLARSLEADPVRRVLAQLQARAAALAARQIHLLALVAGEPERVKAAARQSAAGWRVAIDPQGGYLDILGLPPEPETAPLCVVLRPDSRIAAIYGGTDQAERAAATALALCPEAAGPVIQAQAPVLLVDSIFPPAFCGRLIDAWSTGERQADRVSGHQGHHASAALKRRDDHIIQDPALSREIQAYFLRRLVPELARALQFRITKSEFYRIGCYDSSGQNYFRRHRDTGVAVNLHRRFAVSLNLNAEFEGGEVIFPEYGNNRYRPPAGGAVVFSCGLLHEALPVTRGRRFGLFTFLSGETVRHQA